MTERTGSAAYFYETIKQRRMRMRASDRTKTRNPKMPVPIYPWAMEKQYYALVHRIIFQKIGEHLNSMLSEENYKRWVDEAHVSLDSARLDDYPAEITRIVGSLDGFVAGIWKDGSTTKRELEEALSKTATQTMSFTKGQWQKGMKVVVGADHSTEEAWWLKAKAAWTQENYNLIKSLSAEEIKWANDSLFSAVRRGVGWKDLKAEMVKSGIIPKDSQGREMTGSKLNNRLRLIARDQVGKLNGALTKARQTELGIQTYEWMTAGDERVRGNPGGKYPKATPSHYKMQGKLCRWDNAGVWSLDGGKTWTPRPTDVPQSHPGEPIQCRCQALANVDDLIEDVDIELGDKVSKKQKPVVEKIGKPLLLDSEIAYANYVEKRYSGLLDRFMEQDPKLTGIAEALEGYIANPNHAALNEFKATGIAKSPTDYSQKQLKKYTTDITKYIEDNPLQDRVMLHRAVITNTELQVGQEIKHAGFVSSTTDKAYAEAFGKDIADKDDKISIFSMNAPAGSKFAPAIEVRSMEDMGMGVHAEFNVREREFIGTGINTKVVGKKVVGNITYYDMEVIPEVKDIVKPVIEKKVLTPMEKALELAKKMKALQKADY